MNQRRALDAGRKTPVWRVGSRWVSTEVVRSVLAERLPGYLDQLHALATTSPDPRVRLDASRYLVDRQMGKPSERVQVEQVPVTVVAPTDEQLRDLAGAILPDATLTADSQNPGPEGVPATPAAVIQ